jgi:hypothetical protein
MDRARPEGAGLHDLPSRLREGSGEGMSLSPLYLK